MGWEGEMGQRLSLRPPSLCRSDETQRFVRVVQPLKDGGLRGSGGWEVGGVGVGGDEPLTAARGDERGRVSEDQISLSVSLHQ